MNEDLQLFFITSIIEIIIQIIMFLKFNNNSTKKRWNRFLGINIAVHASNFLALTYFLSSNIILGLTWVFECIVICGSIFCGNLTLLIIGIIKKYKVKKIEDSYETKYNIISVILICIIILCNLFIIFIIPKLRLQTTFNKRRNIYN